MLESFKIELKEEKSKLKKMKSFKDRWDYIWEYYKLPIIGIIFVLCTIAYVINLTLINPPKKRGVGLTLITEALPNQEVFKANAEKAINVQEGYELVINNLYLDDSQSTEYQKAIKQKFLVMLAASEIDLIIGIEDFFGELNSTQGLFMNLDQALSDSKYDSIRDKFIYGLIPVKSAGEIDESEIVDYVNPVDQQTYKCVKRPIAISLKDNEVLEQLGYNTYNTYIAFIANSPRMEKALELFDYIFSLD